MIDMIVAYYMLSMLKMKLKLAEDKDRKDRKDRKKILRVSVVDCRAMSDTYRIQ